LQPIFPKSDRLLEDPHKIKIWRDGILQSVNESELWVGMSELAGVLSPGMDGRE